MILRAAQEIDQSKQDIQDLRNRVETIEGGDVSTRSIRGLSTSAASSEEDLTDQFNLDDELLEKLVDAVLREIESGPWVEIPLEEAWEEVGETEEVEVTLLLPAVLTVGPRPLGPDPCPRDPLPTPQRIELDALDFDPEAAADVCPSPRITAEHSESERLRGEDELVACLRQLGVPV